MPVVHGTWTLHHDGRPVARLVVTDIDFPWVRGRAETLPGYENVRALFEEQERLLDAEEYDALDAVYARIRAATSMTFPDGAPVAEYLLNIHDDGTCGWRWHDEPFDG
jgi:hypothetical protein